jgi:hypothetical protein
MSRAVGVFGIVAALALVAACKHPTSSASSQSAVSPYQPPLRCNARGPEYIVPLPGTVLPPTGPAAVAPGRPPDAAARAGAIGEAWNRYSEQDKELMKSGWIRAGLDELGVYVARGRPELHFGTNFDGKACHALLYGVRPETQGIDLIVYTCDGVVQRADDVQPPLPCDRATDVGPRVAERAPQFAQLTPDRQWLALRGQVQKDMTPFELETAWGAPARRGEEGRPDGSRAVLLYWNSVAGQSMLVTFVNDRVASWKTPAEGAAGPATEKRVTLGACTYTDVPTGALGTPCQASAPCIAGYVCKATAGVTGICVPAAQDHTCAPR